MKKQNYLYLILSIVIIVSLLIYVVAPKSIKAMIEVSGVAFGLNPTTDNIGLSTSKSEWESVLGGNLGTILGGLVIGENISIAQWLVKKLITSDI